MKSRMEVTGILAGVSELLRKLAVTTSSGGCLGPIHWSREGLARPTVAGSRPLVCTACCSNAGRRLTCGRGCVRSRFAFYPGRADSLRVYTTATPASRRRGSGCLILPGSLPTLSRRSSSLWPLGLRTGPWKLSASATTTPCSRRPRAGQSPTYPTGTARLIDISKSGGEFSASGSAWVRVLHPGRARAGHARPWAAGPSVPAAMRVRPSRQECRVPRRAGSWTCATATLAS